MTTTSVAETERYALTVDDELELQRFFAADLPEVPGISSNFGAMCERIGNMTNPKTIHKPHGNWMDRVKMRGGASSVRVGAAEDMQIEYIDRHRRVRRVGLVLAHMEPQYCHVLRARYAPSLNEEQTKALRVFGQSVGVALLTTKAMSVFLAVTERSAVDALIDLAGVSKSYAVSDAEKKRAKLIVNEIAAEARDMLADACDSFVRARAEVIGSWHQRCRA